MICTYITNTDKTISTSNKKLTEIEKKRSTSFG